MSSIVSAGDVVAGKYIVEKILGEGGMGLVVAASHRDLGHRVAIKFLQPEALEVEHARAVALPRPHEAHLLERLDRVAVVHPREGRLDERGQALAAGRIDVLVKRARR